MKLNENQKITLTLGQLKRLVRESASNENDFEIKGGVLRKYRGEGGDVVIPDGVTSIGYLAFDECDGVKSVTISDSVTSIEHGAFYKCGLSSVTIPDSVTSIGHGAFSVCGLKSVKIPDSVTNIENFAFFDCPLLTSVEIPNSVTSIGDHAFQGCFNLQSVTIPDSVTSVGNNAFEWCIGLSSITIGAGVRRIGREAFYNCEKLKTIYVANKTQKKMILGRNDLSKFIKIIVKGEESDDGYEVTENESGTIFLKGKQIMKLNENQKITLTIGQLKRLVKEGKDCMRVACIDGDCKETNRIVDMSTSDRIDIVRDFWNACETDKSIHSSFDGFKKWAEKQGFDTTDYTIEDHNQDWDDAAVKYGDEDEEEDQGVELSDGTVIDTKEEAWKWFLTKTDEYGDTYWFPTEVKCDLNRLIDKFGNTYFWHDRVYENQKVTLTLRQLKRLVRESNHKITEDNWPTDEENVDKTGAILNDLLNLVYDNEDEELADEISNVLHKLYDIVVKTELSDKWKETMSDITFAFDKVSEMIASGEIKSAKFDN